MSSLNSAQRKSLRSQAHKLDPLILIGKQGLTDMVVRATAEALEAHELIKVRFNEFKDDKNELVEQLAFRTGCAVAGMIGHVAILYKRHPDPEKRKITLPE